MNGNGYRNSSGGLSIPPIYLYIGIGILAVIIISVIGGLLSAGVQAYFAVAAGALLVLANLRDLLSGAGSSAALMNTMVGAGLIFSSWAAPSVGLVHSRIAAAGCGDSACTAARRCVQRLPGRRALNGGQCAPRGGWAHPPAVSVTTQRQATAALHRSALMQ
jgi:hypothetical protein